MKLATKEFEERSTIAVISECHKFSLKLVGELLSRNCSVFVIDKNIKKWSDTSKKLNFKLEIARPSKASQEFKKISYLIYISPQIFNSEKGTGYEKKLLRKILKINSKYKIKSLIVLPSNYETDSVKDLLENRKKLKNTNQQFYFVKEGLDSNLILQKLFSRGSVLQGVKEVEGKNGPIRDRRNLFRFSRMKLIIGIILFTIAFPIVFLFLNIIIFSIIKTYVYEKNLFLAKIFYSDLRQTSRVSSKILVIYSDTPIINKIYDPFYYLSNYLILSNEIAFKKSEVIISGLELIDKTFGDKDLDLVYYSDNLSLNIQKIYELNGLWEADYKRIGQTPIINRLNIGKFFSSSPPTEKIINYYQLAKNLPDLLGENTPRNYVLVFQNNETIRSSGGLINGIYILKFESGRIKDAAFYTPQKIDENILGIITPPKAVGLYLEKNWKFVDSNWEASLNGTSDKIEWFIDKSLDIKPDGVIFFDLNLIKSLFGQHKDEQTENIVSYLKKLKPPERHSAIILLAKEFKNKDIQIYSNTDEYNLSFTEVGLSNILPPINCGGECLNDFFEIVESDFGRSGYNMDIDRKAKLEMILEGGVIKKRLTLTMSPLRDSGKKHNVYIRLISPLGFGYSPVKIDGKGVLPELEVKDGYKEVGFLLNFGEGKQKIIEVSWEGSLASILSKNRSYFFTWIFQPGVQNFSKSVEIKIPNSDNIKITSNESLTQGTAGVYNTTLSKFNRDLIFGFFWNNQ